jgi:arginyl-tRNA synthetase
MERLGIRYDLLARESEILHLHFWERAFELMKSKGVIRLETEGRHAGCWVMPFESHTGTDEHESDKIIVRSNGTVTYTGKDIAYQLWKLGKLGLDFHYRVFRQYPDEHTLWVTTTDETAEANAGVERPHFGGGERVYNVIDSRQSYPQEIVARGVTAIVPELGEESSVHFSYEMVALSPAACEELGIELSAEDRARPYIEMSGRKGLGVKADDLIDTLIAKAQEEVDSRHPEATAEERRRVATTIAVGALRYFMLKFTRNSVIAFDLREALSFEGETGPYVQYAAVRAGKILAKLAERGEQLPDFRAELTAKSLGRQLEFEDFWQMLLAASRVDAAIERAIASGEPSHVARYAFQLAQEFSTFYQKYPVLGEEDRERRTFLLWMTSYFRDQLTRTLGVLGIDVPPYM